MLVFGVRQHTDSLLSSVRSALILLSEQCRSLLHWWDMKIHIGHRMSDHIFLPRETTNAKIIEAVSGHFISPLCNCPFLLLFHHFFFSFFFFRICNFFVFFFFSGYPSGLIYQSVTSCGFPWEGGREGGRERKRERGRERVRLMFPRLFFLSLLTRR